MPARRRARGKQRGHGRDAGKGASLGPGPEMVLLAVRGDGGVHHGMRAPGADHLEAAGGEAHSGVPGDPRLRAGDERLDVTQRRVEVLALVQPIAVEAGELVLPECLPPGEDQLLELAVRTDQQEGRARLEADPPLDAERRLADVDVAADAVRLGARSLLPRSL